MIPVREDILKSVVFKTSRSGGKGGQNVNKVSSKVELIFNVADASFFTAEEKTMLIERLANRLDQDGNLHVISQEDRSQLLNKERTIVKLIALLKAAMQVQKKRKATKIPKSVVRQRLADKKVQGIKKELRRRPDAG